jgi:hypothetical protein
MAAVGGNTAGPGIVFLQVFMICGFTIFMKEVAVFKLFSFSFHSGRVSRFWVIVAILFSTNISGFSVNTLCVFNILSLPVARRLRGFLSSNILENPGDAVVNVYINQEKKFAFVEMRTVEEASNAMALDGIIFEVLLPSSPTFDFVFVLIVFFDRDMCSILGPDLNYPWIG